MAIHGLALLAVCFNGLPLWVRILLAFAILLIAGLSLRWALRAPAIRELEWRDAQAWTLTTAQGSKLSARLLGSSRVAVGFALLHFRTDERRLELVIWPDSLDPERFRRLRVLLKVNGPDR